MLGKLFIKLQARRNLHPVSSQCCVIRLGRVPKDFSQRKQISAIQLGEVKVFELSSLDKKSVPPHLSVWVDALTTPKQAYSFLPENSPCRLVLRLNVEKVRKLVGGSDEKLHSSLLDVVWVHLIQNVDGEQIRDRRPGAEGHAGIIGLDDKSVSNKLLRKDLRSKLAELASKDCHLLTDK